MINALSKQKRGACSSYLENVIMYKLLNELVVWMPSKLQDNTRLTEAILCNAPACVKILSVEGLLEYVSPKGAELLEIENVDSVLGKDWVGFWNSREDATAARTALDVALAGGVGSFEGYYRTTHGTRKWWDVSAVAIHDEDGQPEGLLVISKDISERKELEQRLVEKNQELQQSIAKLESQQRKLTSTENMLDSLLRQSHS